jgi:hypothetical protein
VGIRETVKQDLHIYPVPVDNIMCIASDEALTAITIHDLLGNAMLV